MSSNNFTFFEVPTREDMIALEVQPPSFCFVRSDGTYYFKYRDEPELEETPFYSGFNGWHNMCSPCPRFDRRIHHLHTRWLNGWDLDWYPDLIDIRQGVDEETPGSEYFTQILGPFQGAPGVNGYNTVITDLRPGDLIYRTQQWSGTFNGVYAPGDLTIEVAGLTQEIADKFFSSRSLPGAVSLGSMRSKGYTNTYLTTILPDGDDITPTTIAAVIDHSPHAPREIVDSPYDGLWDFSGEPTTTLHLKTPLQVAIEHEAAFTLKAYHWYVVSCEHLGSESDLTEWEQPQFCDGHIRRTLDFHHLDAGPVPARYEAMLHTITQESELQQLFEQKRLVPGDLMHHGTWHNWMQALPIYQENAAGMRVLSEDEVKFADFSRTLTVFNRAEFDQYREHFDLNNLYVINLSHEHQGWHAKIKNGFDSRGYITSRSWARYVYKPADIIYYAGRPEQS